MAAAPSSPCPRKPPGKFSSKYRPNSKAGPRPSNPIAKVPRSSKASPQDAKLHGQERQVPAKFSAGAIGSKHFPSIAGRKLQTSFERPALAKEAVEAHGSLELAKLLASLERQAGRPGAFNILRKAIPGFKAKRGLLPRFGLWWLSAQGLLPFKTPQP